VGAFGSTVAGLHGQHVVHHLLFSNSMQDSTDSAIAEGRTIDQFIHTNHHMISSLLTISRMIEQLALEQFQPYLVDSGNFGTIQSLVKLDIPYG
jgi:hypothetical protein